MPSSISESIRWHCSLIPNVLSSPAVVVWHIVSPEGIQGNFPSIRAAIQLTRSSSACQTYPTSPWRQSDEHNAKMVGRQKYFPLSLLVIQVAWKLNNIKWMWWKGLWTAWRASYTAVSCSWSILYVFVSSMHLNWRHSGLVIPVHKVPFNLKSST